LLRAPSTKLQLTLGPGIFLRSLDWKPVLYFLHLPLPLLPFPPLDFVPSWQVLFSFSLGLGLCLFLCFFCHSCSSFQGLLTLTMSARAFSRKSTFASRASIAAIKESASTNTSQGLFLSSTGVTFSISTSPR
jgi:hypothetical protein